MKALDLAKRFKEYLDRVWAPQLDETNEVEDLYSFFGDWVENEEEQVISWTRGRYSVIVLTWAIAAAWFEQRPEDFAAIRPWAPVALDLRPDADGLPTYVPIFLDEERWNDWVFERLHGRP